MKIIHPYQKHEQGTVLLVTLTLGVILLIAAVSYLKLVGTQKTVITRSQTWNAALTMAEAGVEEAMAQINASPTNFSANSWTKSGINYGPVTRSLIGGSYSVSISGDTAPVIYATGYATVPITGDKIARAVSVTTAQPQSVFNVAFAAAVNNIRFNGNGIATDSWNSHTTNYSTNGHYDPNKTRKNGNVASVQGLVDIGNHTIQGNLYLGPTASYAGGGTITGTLYNDFNVKFDAVQLPAGAPGWNIATTTNGNYDFKVSGNYTINQNQPIIVEAGVTVTLNVRSTTFDPSSLKIYGGAANSGTAIFYFNGPTSATIHGNEDVNPSGRPENLYYYGLGSLTSLTFGGNSDFVGVIYAPNATLTLNGGGNNIGLIGSAVVNSITMNGHYNFHYDESLANIGVSRGFIATSWQEL